MEAIKRSFAASLAIAAAQGAAFKHHGHPIHAKLTKSSLGSRSRWSKNRNPGLPPPRYRSTELGMLTDRRASVPRTPLAEPRPDSYALGIAAGNHPGYPGARGQRDSVAYLLAVSSPRWQKAHLRRARRQRRHVARISRSY